MSFIHFQMHAITLGDRLKAEGLERELKATIPAIKAGIVDPDPLVNWRAEVSNLAYFFVSTDKLTLHEPLPPAIKGQLEGLLTWWESHCITPMRGGDGGSWCATLWEGWCEVPEAVKVGWLDAYNAAQRVYQLNLAEAPTALLTPSQQGEAKEKGSPLA